MDESIAGWIEHTPADASGVNHWQRFFELSLHFAAIARQRAAEAATAQQATGSVPGVGLAPEYLSGGQRPTVTKGTGVN